MAKQTAITPSRGFPKTRAHIEEEEFVSRPGVPGAEGDPLWTIYGVNPGLPLRTKIEQLILIWSLSVEEISVALNDDKALIQPIYKELESEWMRIGEGLTEDDRQMARGKLIKELMRMKSELELLTIADDHRVIQMKMNLIERLAKLQGLDTDRAEPPSEAASTNPIEAAIKNLSNEQRCALLTRLAVS